MVTFNILEVAACFRLLAALHMRLLKSRALVISALVHTGVLVVMASCVTPAGTKGTHTHIVILPSGESQTLDGSFLNDIDLLRDAVALDRAAPLPPARVHSSVVDFGALDAAPSAVTDLSLPSLSAILPKETPSTTSHASSAKEVGERLANGAEEALRESDLLVVWLLDSSRSVVDNRENMVTGLETFLEHFDRRPEHSHRLSNAVVSFGATTNERVAPTDSHGGIIAAVRELTADDSGTENTFAAIEKCVRTYRDDQRRRGLSIIVWTDESGDDSTRLEDAIRVCRAAGASVSVVGPTAVLGSESAMQHFTDPATGDTHHLPVTRGPDSAVPERIDMDYWFLTQEPFHAQASRDGFRTTELPSWFGTATRVVGNHQCIAATEVALPAWYGGAELAGLLSGFGPYALTRLASRTGGTYIILDDDENGAPFRVDALRPYLPDTRSVAEYSRAVATSPLRQAVLSAVNVTRRDKIGPPPMLLFGKRSDKPPFGFMRYYFTPVQFAKKLKDARQGLKTRARRTADIVDRALAHVSQPARIDLGLEQAYEQEPSRRWRAWYDLTRGRLLAASVRLEEYRRTCDTFSEPGLLGPTTNYVVLIPSLQLKSNSAFRYRAEQAERLLVRCVRNNPGTPWALLAQRELDYGLGIDVRQFTVALVVMPPSRARKPRLPRL